MPIEKRLAEINKRTMEIRALLESDTKLDMEQLEKINAELRSMELEDRDLRAQLEMKDKIGKGLVGLRVVDKFERDGKKMETVANTTSTLEYRQAFMNLVLRNVKSDILEQRANATTYTTDIGTVIPQPIIDRIYEKMTSHSMIWERIARTNVKGGVSVPTSSLKPVATWVAQGSVADKQKKTTASVIFSYHKLQCRVALSLEADTVSLEVFESTIVQNIYEAMIVAIETAVVAGTGSGQPLGITVDTSIPAGQIISVTAAEVGTFDKWNSIVSNIPLAYEGKVVLTITKKDWDKYIAGMTDAVGQPIARVNLGLTNRPERRVLGYEVVLVDDYLTSFDTAAADDVFAYFVDYKDYIFNSNLQYMYKKYFDEDTDETIHKATLLADGKLAVPHSVILLKKSA